MTRPPPGADVVVVGAGAAGAVLAARLSEDPSRTVVLVEAGERVDDPAMRDPTLWPTLEGKPYDWAYRTTPQPFTAGRIHAWPRGRGLGGSTLLHAMGHVHGHADDFDRWSAVAGPEWSADALRQGFARVEAAYAAVRQRHGEPGAADGGPLRPSEPLVHPIARAFCAAAERLGAPRIPTHNAGRMVGATPNTLLIAGGQRITAADAWLDPAEGRPNLVILTGTTADRLVFAADEPRRITGVAVRSKGGTAVVSAGTVILAAGAIATPLLLMRSGIGDPGHLAAHGIAVRVPSPAVGADLQDHVFAAGAVHITREPYPPSRLQHSESLLYACRGADPWADRAPDLVVACVLAPAVAPGLPPPGAPAISLLFGITHPASRGSVRLSGPGREGPPVIDPAYLSAGEDRAEMRDALALARRLAATAPFADLLGREHLPGPDVADEQAIDAFVARALVTHHHPAGTCRMGLDDRAVVRPDLSVRGTDNLQVCDASMFPSLPSGPINAAVSAVAETFAARFDRTAPG